MEKMKHVKSPEKMGWVIYIGNIRKVSMMASLKIEVRLKIEKS